MCARPQAGNADAWTRRFGPESKEPSQEMPRHNFRCAGIAVVWHAGGRRVDVTVGDLIETEEAMTGDHGKRAARLAFVIYLVSR